MKKRSIGIAILMICCVLLGGCFGATEKEYASNGFKIKVDEELFEKDLATATAYFTGEKTLVMAIKEEFTLLEAVDIKESSTLKDYAEVVIANNKADYEIKEKDGLTYFEYEKEVNGKNYYYLSTVYKSHDAFWLVNFACEKKNKEAYQEKFLTWAKTVEFEK